MADLLKDPAVRHRKKSIGTIEVNRTGGTHVVALDELTPDDAELATNFGYKPVLKRVNTSSPRLYFLTNKRY
jgi:hypothetical protein